MDVTSLAVEELNWCFADDFLRKGTHLVPGIHRHVRTRRQHAEADGEVELEAIFWVHACDADLVSVQQVAGSVDTT